MKPASLFLAPFLLAGGFLLAQDNQPAQQKDPPVPDLAELVAKPQNEFRIVTQRFELDRGNLTRFYNLPSSPTRHARLKRFYGDWSKALAKLNDAKLSEPARADRQQLSQTITAALQQLELDAKGDAEASPLVPFAAAIVALHESRQRMDKVDAARAAGLLHDAKKQIQRLSQALTAATKEEGKPAGFVVSPALAQRAGKTTLELRGVLTAWFNFYNAYDPVFTWWMNDVYKELNVALEEYAALVRDKGPGVTLPKEALTVPAKIKVADPANPRFAFPAKESDAPDLGKLMTLGVSELREVLPRYQADRVKVSKWAALPGKAPKTPEGKARLKEFDNDWLAALGKLDFDKLSQEGRVDYLLLRNHIQRELRRLDLAPPKEAPKKDASGIVGQPIGREALLVELAGEMIVYTPEELIAIAQKEFAWCEAEMKIAAHDMGFGDNWLKAVEKVKTQHVEPGKQPQMIRNLAWEAIAYMQKHDLVTVPALAQETWRMEMMSPQRQLVTPFFTGGEVISVAFPTNTMKYEDRLQSLRGNNLHFARATVHHELIPGHHLQLFMRPRHAAQRQNMGTPFWLEGWALYWELRLYERGFVKSPEDRVGFLFWRMHRCARIEFSLKYHLGQWSPEECIDFLVKRVGHEPANATAEVRRSVQGNYGPLYQAAYLLGGMQIFALHKEVMQTGQMSERAFHDAVLQANSIPIEMVRALVTQQKLSRDYTPGWKFRGE